MAVVIRARTWRYRLPPGPQRRFTTAEVAEALGVDTVTVRRWIERGWLRARRTWKDWTARRQPDGWSIRGRAVTRALEVPQVIEDMLNARTRAIRAA